MKRMGSRLFRRKAPRLSGLLIGALLLSGTARASESLAVESDDTSVAVQVINDRPAVVSLVGRGNGFDWVGGTERASAMGLIESAEVGGVARPLHWKWKKDADRKNRPGEKSFVFACDDPALELVCAWEGHAGPGPVEQRVTIYNRGKEEVRLPVQTSLAIGMHAPAGHAIEQRWVDKGAGTPTKDGVHKRAIDPAAESLLRCWPSGRDDPRDPIPWTLVEDVEGRQGWYAGVEFTARVNMQLQAGPAGAGPAGMPMEFRVGMPAEDEFPFFTRVGPGESFEAPPVFIGCFQGDVDDGANRLRRWVRTTLVPATRDEKYPLLVNNSWGSGMAVDERLSRKMIDESAELGLEMFHIDAGWFRTVGDWRADEKKFPNGLGPIADYAHQRGLKFGLWVGWTQGGDQVDPTGRHSIAGVHDPVMSAWFSQKFAKDWKANDFSGGTLCLGEPKAVEWCLNTLRRVVKESKIDMLEHDQTMVVDGCEQGTHLHTASCADAGYRAAQGYYRVYDTLRAENPDLLFENCVNGGHMIDYGAVRRCHYISITDTYDPLSNRRAFHDASYALPPAMCECYVQNIAVRGPAHFKFMLRSGMMGWCTIMTDTNVWTPEQHEAAKKQFALYKARLRPLIRSADLYHVSDRPDGVRWDGIQYYDPSSRTGALLAFRGTGDEAQHAFVLRGLTPGAKYAIEFEDGSSQPEMMTGTQLMSAGVKLNLPERESSEIVYIRSAFAQGPSATAPAEFRADNGPVTPVNSSTVIAEAEEFRVETPVRADGVSGWQPRHWGDNYYAATLANTFLSRKAYLGAPEQADNSRATIVVKVPGAGRYLALRDEAAPRFQTQFRLRIEQGGRTRLDRLYGGATTRRSGPSTRRSSRRRRGHGGRWRTSCGRGTMPSSSWMRERRR